MPGSTLIALLIEPVSWANRQMLEGITAYARQHSRWRFVLQELTADGTVDKWIMRAKPAGVIAGITSPGMARMLRRMGVPIVDVLEEHPTPHIPQIVCDDQKVVRRAVDHLLDKGLRSLAFLGDRDRQFAKRRCSFFRDHAMLRHRQLGVAEKAAKNKTATMLLPASALLPGGAPALADWLTALPKPVGIVACNDEWGSHILRVCSELDLHVPDDVAVIGAEDDAMYCQMSDPLLSSIDCHAQAIGSRAAAMLDGMIRRGESPPPITFIEPGAVQGRGSTDVLAIADPEAVSAIRFLREYACTEITPTSAASKLGISRRTLERIFTRYVGHSPAEELRRVRLERARELLAATALPLADVAHRVGIPHVESFHRAFKRRFGSAPGRYRSENSLRFARRRRGTASREGVPP